jgi:CHC2 zinc finger
VRPGIYRRYGELLLGWFRDSQRSRSLTECQSARLIRRLKYSRRRLGWDKERGEQWHGFCPLPTHEGKRQSPSFSANVGRGIWQCFGCGAKGNLIEFAARMEGLNPDDPGDFRKAALLLQKMFVGKDGGEREKPKATPKGERRERSAQEDVEEKPLAAL